MTDPFVEYVHLVRHGLPIQLEGASGVPDPGLTGYGHRQAEAVAHWWAGRPTSGVVTSQMRRAGETTGPLARSMGMEPTIDDGVAEFSIGEDFYLPITDIYALGDNARIAWWRDRLHDADVVGARAAFRRDAIAAFGRITEVSGDGPLLVFTHGGFIAAVVSDALGLPDAVALDADYASITTLRRKPTGGWVVVSFSETQHLSHLEPPRQAAGISLEQ